MIVLSSHFALLTTSISLALTLLTSSVDAAAIYSPRHATAFPQRDDATLQSRGATGNKTVIIQMFEWNWDRCVHHLWVPP